MSTRVTSFRFTDEERKKLDMLVKMESDGLKRAVTIKDIIASQINKAYDEALERGVLRGKGK